MVHVIDDPSLVRPSSALHFGDILACWDGMKLWNGKTTVKIETIPYAFSITGSQHGFHAHTWADAKIPVNFGKHIGDEIKAFLALKQYDYFVLTISGVVWAMTRGCCETFSAKGKGYARAAKGDEQVVRAIIKKYSVPLRQILC